MKNIVSLVVILALITLTRGHTSTLVHLPDFTIPALFIAGVYMRQNWIATLIILAAVVIDNYVILYQGVSANCITPAYSVLLASYYAVFWASKSLTTLTIDKNIIKNIAFISLIVGSQWLIATSSYYAFTQELWSAFPSYASKWIWAETSSTLQWLAAVSIALSLGLRFNPNVQNTSAAA